jgi:hypothetical protein
VYRLSKDSRFFIKTMKKRYKVQKEVDKGIVFNFSDVRMLPIIELCAAGSLIDADYLKNNFPRTLKDPFLIPHFFYLLRERSPLLVITKDDILTHYSSDNLKSYLAKLKWRIINNIFYYNMAKSGYSGRNSFDDSIYKYKKYFYPIYALSILFPLLDSLVLVYSRRNLGYFIHIVLTLITILFIIYYSSLKLINLKPRLKSYDNSIEIKNYGN